MEKLKLNGIGSWGVPSLIRDVLINLWNNLSNKINELIDGVTAIEEDIITIEETISSLGESEPSAPTELVYKALLTQTGTNPPVARVLNQNDADFLSTISWIYEDIGKFYTPNLDESLTMHNFQPSTDHDNIYMGFIEVNDANNLMLFTYTNGLLAGDLANGILNNTYVEIRTRVRGEAPQVVSIETIPSGDFIKVRFDKPMNPYIFTGLDAAITLSGSKTITAITLDENNFENTGIIIAIDSPYMFGDEITFSFDASINWESLDLGLVAKIVDAVVVNNVEYLQS